MYEQAANDNNRSLYQTDISEVSGDTVVPVEVTDPGEIEQKLKQRCNHLGIEWFDEAPEIENGVSSKLSADDAIRLRLIPIAIMDDVVKVVMRDPLDLAAVDEASVLIGMTVERCGLDADIFRKLIESEYGTTAARMAERLAGDDDSEENYDSNIEAIDADDLHRMAEQPTLINLVNLIVIEAIKSRASDVHIEPFETELKIKYRIDGILHEQIPPPKHLQPAIISRVKIMAAMNIAERYIPQDGHITLRFEGGRKVDLRVSTVPTLYGESVVLRILDKSTLPLELSELGMWRSDVEIMDQLIKSPHGMILVTGPTGSGKTTTLYAALQLLYTPEKKIITIEDPVEYELAGVNQIQVNPKRGLSFATGLRSILRQDPDVVMVGEIRDGETAEIAVRSALTGHLVFSTVHTNDAVSAITRLMDMNVEPFLVASVIEGILAQRLGRRICPECRQAIEMDEALTHRLTEEELRLFNGRCFKGSGCDKCDDSGTKGRVGFFEILVVNSQIRQAISERLSAREILARADERHVSMRTDGLYKAVRGVTTIGEVMKATQDTEEGN